MISSYKQGPSAFAQRVYDLLRQIPEGKVVTYKVLAQAMECRSAQAIGQALKRNPFAPEVPCHRVIRSDWRIGGYEGALEGEAPQRKMALLQAEGVVFHDGVLADATYLYNFKTTNTVV